MCQALCGRLCHWGPLVAIVIIKWVTLCTVFCNTMFWPPADSFSGLFNMMGFLSVSCLTTYHFVAAMFDGPGYVDKGWKPKDKKHEDYLQFCNICQGYKAPRSHHCRKCNRCVKKMDHHCPWINNCVGHSNHGHFIGFLFFAVVGCSQASYILAMSLYYGLNRSWYLHYGSGLEPQVILTLPSLIIILLALGLAIGVVLAVGALLFFQLRSAWRNQTCIEDWIMEKASYRLKHSEEKFQNPYFLGRWDNLRQVLTMACIPVGDGIEWPLREGAGEFDMTIEQLNQKRDKRDRTREYKIVRSFSGSWFPLWSMGFKVACHPPCTDEPRISLDINDLVRVTRWKKHWLYGDKELPKSSKKMSTTGDNRIRGWFPRKCAVDLVDVHQERINKNKENRKNK